MYVRAMGTGWRTIVGAAAVGGYLLAKHGPVIKERLEPVVRDAIKCGLRASDEVWGCSERVRTAVRGYVEEVRTEMASETAAEQAAPATEQA